ncbi:MAG: hypothetical protein BV457_03415 [Thermoplasmata archaeon M9B1D]|nr:MAG: hypothetical protein BV457_03415 [Thermoplasmata archaeon M9B1D]
MKKEINNMDKQLIIAEEINNLHYITLKHQLMMGEVISINRDMLEKLLSDMNDINILLIQKSYGGIYWCKVDDITMTKYKEDNDGEIHSS